jgi:hypothetical protein
MGVLPFRKAIQEFTCHLCTFEYANTQKIIKRHRRRRRGRKEERRRVRNPLSLQHDNSYMC